MFPNPQDALPLPPRPNLDQYKKRAKDLLRAAQSPDPAALRTWTANWVDSLVRLSDLSLTPQLPVRIDHWTDQLETFAREILSESATLTSAQFVIARAQGFESWPKLAKHLEEIMSANSPANSFELAVDAIVMGDVATLEKLLHEHPELVLTRSPRRHQATLLHYISANGVEGYRQKTPKNIVPIAKLLLDAGADVHAIADVYGGSTTLTLVATSVHPERAGVQESLMQHCSTTAQQSMPKIPNGPSLVTTCLANGRVQAAEFLAQRGAILDLEGAAGLGRLETVKKFFDDDPQRNLKDQTDRTRFAVGVRIWPQRCRRFPAATRCLAASPSQHRTNRAALGRNRRTPRHYQAAPDARRPTRSQKCVRRNGLGPGPLVRPERRSTS